MLSSLMNYLSMTRTWTWSSLCFSLFHRDIKGQGQLKTSHFFPKNRTEAEHFADISQHNVTDSLQLVKLN